MTEPGRDIISRWAERNASDREGETLKENGRDIEKRPDLEDDVINIPAWNVRGGVRRIREGVGKIINGCLRAYDTLAWWLLSYDTG